MWENLFEGHDQVLKRLDHPATISTIMRAIIFDWPTGKGNARAIRILEQHYSRLPAFTQLNLHALKLGFGVIDSRPIADRSGNRVIGGWSYARVLYASPGGPTYEFMVRYRPEDNLESSWGNGFEVFAVKPGPSWVPTQLLTGGTSSNPVADLYNMITNPPATLPINPGTTQPYTSLAAYLDSLGRVQVLGHQVPQQPNQPPTTLPTLDALVQ